MEKREFEARLDGPNRVVVQVPGRRFPGVVIQGDTLSSFCQLSSEILKFLEAGDTAEALDSAESLNDSLLGYLNFYETILNEYGIELPYVKAEPAQCGQSSEGEQEPAEDAKHSARRKTG